MASIPPQILERVRNTSRRKRQNLMTSTTPPNNPIKLTYMSTNELITCIDILYNIIAIGSSEGKVYFCNLNNLSKPFFIANHGAAVIELQFWVNREYMRCSQTSNTTHHGLAASSCTNGIVKFWNYEFKFQLKTEDFIGRIIPFKWTYMFTTVWENVVRCYVWIARLEAKQMWDMFLPFSPNEEIVAKSDINDDSDREPVSILTFDGFATRKYEISTPYHRAPECSVKQFYKCFDEIVNDCWPKRFYWCFDYFAICLAGEYMSFSIDQYPWISYNMEEHVGAKVTTVLLTSKATRLIMGLETGAVLAYQASDYINWINYDFKTMTPVSTFFFDRPIEMLRFYDVSDSAMVLIVATSKNIYIHELTFRS